MKARFDLDQLTWTREPKAFTIAEDKITITTAPQTDLWQRTYYHFQNDNAPVLQLTTGEEYFSFEVKTSFASQHRFDQCDVVMYLDSENWLKASIEYETEDFQHLGSVATNRGYSDWVTTEIPADIKEMWYRLSRRGKDFRLDCSIDGVTFKQMRICHMDKADKEVSFGIYACSPEESSFVATFTDFELTDCQWQAHDGQQPE